MPVALPSPIDCCAKCDDAITTLVPGSDGTDGANGSNGANGANAYTALTAGFTMPAIGDTVIVQVADSSWIAIDQVLLITSAGYLKVTAKPSANHVTIRNLGYDENAAGGAAIANGSAVAPAGVRGPQGATGTGVPSGPAGGDLKGSYPNPKIAVNNAKGALLVGNGTDSIAQPVGANGTRPKFDSAQATGMSNSKVDLAASSEVTGVLAIVNGGTGGASEAAARASLGLSNSIRGVALFTDTKAPATNGGAAGSLDTYNKRTLNTSDYNTISGASLATSQITLPAGTYRVHARAPASGVDTHQIRFRNVTDGATVGIGTIEYIDDGELWPTMQPGAQTTSELRCRFTIAGAKTFELQHATHNHNQESSNYDYGQASPFSENAIYSMVYIEQE